eukprot:176844_1
MTNDSYGAIEGLKDTTSQHHGDDLALPDDKGLLLGIERASKTSPNQPSRFLVAGIALILMVAGVFFSFSNSNVTPNEGTTMTAQKAGTTNNLGSLFASVEPPYPRCLQLDFACTRRCCPGLYCASTGGGGKICVKKKRLVPGHQCVKLTGDDPEVDYCFECPAEGAIEFSGSWECFDEDKNTNSLLEVMGDVSMMNAMPPISRVVTEVFAVLMGIARVYFYYESKILKHLKVKYE